MTPKASNKYLSLHMVVLREREKDHMFAESCLMGSPHEYIILETNPVIMSHGHLSKHTVTFYELLFL